MSVCRQYELDQPPSGGVHVTRPLPKTQEAWRGKVFVPRLGVYPALLYTFLCFTLMLPGVPLRRQTLVVDCSVLDDG